MTPFIPMHEVLAPGERGPFKLDHFEIAEPTMRMMLKPREFIPPGKYVRLTVNGYNTVMSDTPEEHRSNWTVVHKAHGDVLIAGLGIGMVLLPILRKPEVITVTIIEKYPEVIELVASQLRAAVRHHESAKLVVHLADALEWRPPPGRKWSTIYFDIWNDICTDNLKDIAKLKRRFSRRLIENGWMGAWAEADLRYKQRQEKRIGW